MIRASVRIAAGAELHAGDELVHVGDGTARPARSPVEAKAAFARVLTLPLVSEPLTALIRSNASC